MLIGHYCSVLNPPVIKLQTAALPVSPKLQGNENKNMQNIASNYCCCLHSVVYCSVVMFTVYLAVETLAQYISKTNTHHPDLHRQANTLVSEANELHVEATTHTQ